MFDLNKAGPQAEPQASPCFNAALEYLDQGFSIIPIETGGKRPLLRSWKEFQDRHATEEEVEAWFRQWPAANIALVTGKVSGVVAVDIDGKAGASWASENLPLPSVMQKTSKGHHLFFKHPGSNVDNAAGFVPEVDIRGDGGYVVIAPSIHPSGKKYELEFPGGGDWNDLADFPTHVFKAEQKKTTETSEDDIVEEGSRNDSLTKMVGRWCGRGLNEAEVGTLALAWNNRFCRPPLPPEEVLTIVRSIGKREAQKVPEALNFNLNEMRAGRFVVKKPDPIDWTFTNNLQKGSVGIVVADGGTGKGFFLLEALASIATGKDVFGGILKPARKGRAFGLFAEDPEEALHHRVHSLDRALGERGDGIDLSLPEFSRDLNENLFIPNWRGQDLRLMAVDKGNYMPSPFYVALLDGLKQIEDLELVVLEPVSRLFSGNENDNAAATYFCSLLERIAVETGATVLVSHHSNKEAGRKHPQATYETFLQQGSSRGASGFVNGARWVLNLVTLSQGEAAEIGGDDDKPGCYVAGRVVKRNLGKAEGTFFLERGDGGVLRRFNPLEKKAQEWEARGEIKSIIAGLEGAGGRFTVNQFCREHQGRVRGLSREALKAVIESMLGMAQLGTFEEKNARGKKTEYLTTKIVPKSKGTWHDEQD